MDKWGLAGEVHWHHLLNNWEEMRDLFDGVTFGGKGFDEWRSLRAFGVLAVGEEHVTAGGLHNITPWDKAVIGKMRELKQAGKLADDAGKLNVEAVLKALQDLKGRTAFKPFFDAAIDAPVNYVSWTDRWKAAGLRGPWVNKVHAQRLAVRQQFRGRLLDTLRRSAAGPAKLLLQHSGEILLAAELAYYTRVYRQHKAAGRSHADASHLASKETSWAYSAGWKGSELAHEYLLLQVSNSDAGNYLRQVQGALDDGSVMPNGREINLSDDRALDLLLERLSKGQTPQESGIAF